MTRLLSILSMLSIALVFSPDLEAAPKAAASQINEGDADAHVLAQAARRRTRKRRTRKRKSPRRKRARRVAKVAIPIDIGVGSIALLPNGPLLFEQAVHPALMLTTGALIDGDIIRKNKNRIPRQYQRFANGVGRVRIRPWWAALIPSQVIVSPGKALGVSGTDLYGGIWHPFGLGITPIQNDNFRVFAGAHLTGMLGYLDSSAFGPTFLLRPGLGAEVHAEVEFTKRFAVVLGWSSDFFIPQALGRNPLEVLPIEESLFHLGGPFLRFHFRVPYEVAL